MLAGCFLVLVRWLQPKKAPSQQAQSPRPPRLRAVCSLGLVQWLQPQETASPQAPVRPPLGLPSYPFWGFLPCVPCLINITLFGAPPLRSLLAAHARWVLPCAGAVAPAQESTQPASAIPPPAPLAGCLFLGAGAVAPAPRNSQPPSSRPPPAGAPKLPFRWSQQNGFSKKKSSMERKKSLPW